jgi:hypothetical protein
MQLSREGYVAWQFCERTESPDNFLCTHNTLTGRHWIIGHVTANGNYELTEKSLADVERDQNKIMQTLKLPRQMFG